MQITITEPAQQEISNKMDSQTFSLKLVFNAEGCGCAVNGIPELWLLPKTALSIQELETESPPFQIRLDKHHEIYFEAQMTIDYQPHNRTFQLKSNNQMYHANMSLIQKTGKEGA
jgi:uncharacterized protein YqkB